MVARTVSIDSCPAGSVEAGFPRLDRRIIQMPSFSPAERGNLVLGTRCRFHPFQP
jgi:hypothetical protein